MHFPDVKAPAQLAVTEGNKVSSKFRCTSHWGQGEGQAAQKGDILIFI